MIPAINASKIYSILGNNDSLVPLAIKDVANSMGLTAGSYATGDKVEGKDRFIDEFGTQAIWLFGIPVYKKMLDLTLFKSMKLDPEIDARILKNSKILEKAKEFAPTEAIKQSIEKVSQNQKLYKGLTIGKFAASTVLTVASYFALTKFRHKYTEEQIKKDFFERQIVEKNKFSFNSAVPFSASFKDVHKAKQPTFTSGMQDFIFNPVKNLMLVDASITGERLAHSRNGQDLTGYVVKEGGFWMFMYFAGKKIQTMLENHTEKKYNKSIDLDARVIESKTLRHALKNDLIKQDLKLFPINGTDAEIHEFINKNPDNIVVKSAKRADIISTVKNSRLIDTRKYIDIDEVKSTAKKLAKLDKQFTQSGETLDTFLKSVKGLKRSAVLKNIGACIGALGIAVPAIMVALRFADKNNKEFQTKKDIEAKLAANN